MNFAQLESREVPAVFGVGMQSPFAGDVGESAATFTGGIALDTTLPMQDGSAVITAATPFAAIQAALTNTITATVGSQFVRYEADFDTIAITPTAHLPFYVSTTEVPGQFKLHLEDLAHMPGLPPDWDYNDRTWTVTVTELTAISIATPAPAEESADGSRPVVVELIRTNGSAGSLDQPLYLPFTLSGTATPGVDYQLPSANIAVFWPGESTTKIVLPALPDADIEGPETIIVQFPPTNGVSPGMADTTVIIDDPGTSPLPPPAPPMVWVSSSHDGEERVDGSRPMAFELSRTNPNDPTAPPLTVSFGMSGSATPEDDYAGGWMMTATFAAGELTTWVTLPVVDDSLTEGTESVVLELIGGSEYTIWTEASARVANIYDPATLPPPPPPVPPPSVLPEVWVSGSLDGEERADGLRPVVFQLSRTNPNDPDEAPPLTVSFSLSGTASSVSDYFAPTDYSVVFAPGQLRTTVTLAVKTDSTPEELETVLLTVTEGAVYTVREGADTGWADIIEMQRGAITGNLWFDSEQNGIQNHFQDVGDLPKAGVRVTLYSKSGQPFAITTSDDDGNYAFADLPFNTYRVSVVKWPTEDFVSPGYGGPLVDSDVDQNGVSGPVQVLTPGTIDTPSADVDGGFLQVKPTQNVPARSVIIGDIHVPLGAMATELKVAKWSDGERDRSGAFTGGKDWPVVKKIGQSTLDFIDDDPDRFSILIYDPQAVGNRIDVELKTTNVEGRDNWDDNPTTIPLVRITNKPNDPWNGWFWSDTQLLVSNVGDDKYHRSAEKETRGTDFGGGIAEDEDPPSATEVNTKFGSNFPVGDRTHMVALRGKVKVTYTPAGGQPIPKEVEVKVRKQLTVRVYILKDPGVGDGDPVALKVNVERHVDRAREAFAQVGIDIDPEIITEESTPAARNGLPKVDLSDGLQLTGGPKPPGGEWTLSGEMKALLQNTVERTGPYAIGVSNAGGRDDIEVYYINHLSDAVGRKLNVAGLALCRIEIPETDESKHADAVIIASDTTGRDYNLAHELFHILENRLVAKLGEGHYPYNLRKNSTQDMVNLMVEGGRAVHGLTKIDGDFADAVLYSKRLTQEQQDKADVGVLSQNHNAPLLLRDPE